MESRKVLYGILILVLAFMLAACAGSNENSGQTDSDSQANTQTTQEQITTIQITAGQQTFTGTLSENETAEAFAAMLPLTLDMNELNGNEKYHYFDNSLPQDASRPAGIEAGDLMLYGSDCLVLFYESFSSSYSYTPIGRIENPDGLAQVLGSGGVQVTFAPL